MSDPVTALGGASFDGLVRITEVAPRGMITLKGELGSTKLVKACTDLAGVEFPGRRQARLDGAKGLLWMAPDEVLVLVPHAEVARGLAALAPALKGEHHLAVDVSDARCLFRLEGADAREVLAKLTPADLHPDSFGPGEVRRTRLAQVPAAFWIPDSDTVEVVAFRSVARYVFDILTNAAAEAAHVDYF